MCAIFTIFTNIIIDIIYTLFLILSSLYNSRTLDYIDLGDGVHAVCPLESLGSISHVDFVQCPIESRSLLMSGIQLNDGQHYVSDIFLVNGNAFHSQEKITLRAPIHHSSFPASATVRVKTKSGDKWIDVDGDIIVRSIFFSSIIIA